MFPNFKENLILGKNKLILILSEVKLFHRGSSVDTRFFEANYEVDFIVSQLTRIQIIEGVFLECAPCWQSDIRPPL